MNGPIDRQAAIEIVDFECGGELIGTAKIITKRLSDLPSVQLESCEDAVSREAISEWLKQYGQDILHGKYKFSLMYIWKNLMDLPSVQPELIRCKDCKHSEHWYRDKARCFLWHEEGIDVFEDGYCSYAERKEGEVNG